MGRKRASVRKEKWAEWVLSPAVSHKATVNTIEDGRHDDESLIRQRKTAGFKTRSKLCVTFKTFCTDPETT